MKESLLSPTLPYYRRLLGNIGTQQFLNLHGEGRLVDSYVNLTFDTNSKFIATLQEMLQMFTQARFNKEMMIIHHFLEVNSTMCYHP